MMTELNESNITLKNDNLKNDNSKNDNINNKLNIFLNMTRLSIFKKNNYIDYIFYILFIISSIISGSQFIILDTISGFGYLFTSTFIIVSIYNIKDSRLKASMNKQVNILKIENDELQYSNDELKNNINTLNSTNNNLSENITTLKDSIGLLGENSDEIIEKLKKLHFNIKIENDRHSLLVKSQCALQIMQIFNHFDNNNNLVLEMDEINNAKTQIMTVLPNLKWSDLENNIKNNKLKVDDIIYLIK